MRKQSNTNNNWMIAGSCRGGHTNTASSSSSSSSLASCRCCWLCFILTTLFRPLQSSSSFAFFIPPPRHHHYHHHHRHHCHLVVIGRSSLRRSTTSIIRERDDGRSVVVFALQQSSTAVAAAPKSSSVSGAAAAEDDGILLLFDDEKAVILEDIDRSHYEEMTTWQCSHLASEGAIAASTGDDEIIIPKEDGDYGDEKKKKKALYRSPVAPVLTEEAATSLRYAARRHFEKRRKSNDNGAWGVETADLGDLLSAEEDDATAAGEGKGGDADAATTTTTIIGWRKELDDALTKRIYPLIRSSNWPTATRDVVRRSALPITTVRSEGEIIGGSSPSRRRRRRRRDGEPPHPVLAVASATLYAGCGRPGAGAALTPLERDAGLFVVHVDLGNDNNDDNDDDDGSRSKDATSATMMGALYLESLAAAAACDDDDETNVRSRSGDDDDDPIIIVGPLSPGRMAVHPSTERAAAIVVPSDILIRSSERRRRRNTNATTTKSTTLDTASRRRILKAAEGGGRHYALRLILNTVVATAKIRDDDDNNEEEQESEDDDEKLERERRPPLAEDAHGDDRNKPNDGMESRVVVDDDDESAHLARMADALERSARLGSAAVRACAVDGIDDLAMCLNALAETRCRMGEFEEALEVVDRWAECGSLRSALAVEDVDRRHESRFRRESFPEMPSYEWIRTRGREDDDVVDKRVRNSRDVAVTTVGDARVFDPDDVALLRDAADEHFAMAAGTRTSRYTMQYEGNSEVHLDDLCSANPILKVRIDRILQERVYPLVRAAFSEDEDEPAPLGSLCVYDSIFVRYDAEKAKAAGRIGASQPLHQDGGIYSINIALNDHKDDDDENGFTGGGTFFEALTLGDGDHIKRPSAPGHAIIHKTTQRHAGAPTTSGVRDILVIFMTARQPAMSEIDEITWRVERAMRLTPIAKELTRDKIIPLLTLATTDDPTSHALSYCLGVHLIQEGDMDDPSDERWDEICRGVEAFERSTVLNPADARAYYNLGMAISARHKYAMRTRRMHLLPPAQVAADSLIHALETAIQLERKCDKAGCNNGINLAEAFFTLGDFVLRLKGFVEARTYLNQVEDSIRGFGHIDENWAQAMLEEVSAMLDYINENEAPSEK